MKKINFYALLSLFLACQPSCSSTTIAADGQTMSSDSQITVNGCRKEKIRNKISVINGSTIGCAGDLAEAMEFKLWWSVTAPVNGLPPEDAPHPKFKCLSALVALPDGTLWLYEEKCEPKRVLAPFAIGTGTPYALLAMLNGKTSAEAVEVACETDLFSSGPVITVPVASIPVQEC